VGAVDRLALRRWGEGALTALRKRLWHTQNFATQGCSNSANWEDKRQVFMRQTLSLPETKDKNLSSYLSFYHWEVSEGKKNYLSF